VSKPADSLCFPRSARSCAVFFSVTLFFECALSFELKTEREREREREIDGDGHDLGGFVCFVRDGAPACHCVL
jgi:hypothetical protein